MFDKIAPEWIWMPGFESRVNQYVEFRREFEVSGGSGAELSISVDTNFAAWVNGVFVGAGQFADFPANKTFSRMNVSVALKPGKNVLTVLVHYCGVNHFSYIPWQPGLWYKLQTAQGCIVSNSQTLCRRSTTYQEKDCSRLTIQMGYTFNYDAAGQDNWRDVSYTSDFNWKPAVVCKEQTVPAQRPLPMLEYKARSSVRVIAQGLLKRPASDETTVAQKVQSDFLSACRAYEIFNNVKPDEDIIDKPVSVTATKITADGFYAIYDIGREECGLVDIELDAKAGTIVDIAIGEHLDDMRVRAAIGGRNFASRLITRDGKNYLTHYTNRYAGRYVELHVTNLTGDMTIDYSGLLPAEYPVKMSGAFESSDSLESRIFDTSRRTMHLCMHEHYEDCPWREQALYANDSRNQALAGYYAFGEYDFPRVCFDLLRQSFSPDGYQELCAPMKFDFTIPGFTMAWYLAIEDYMRYSGDTQHVQKILPMISDMLDAYHGTIVDNLLPCPTGKRYWQFYDWADGLEGMNVWPLKGGLNGRRFDAPLNFIYASALRAVANMAHACGDAKLAKSCNSQADATAKAAHAFFWDGKAGAYKTYIGEQALENHFAELTQSLALLCGGCDANRAAMLRTKLADENNGMVKTTLSQSLYKFEALLQDVGTYGKYVFDKIRKDWGMMLGAGSTSFWETIRGGWDFDCAGSMCHGWSGIPAYFYGAYALGVKPLDNGFKVFAVAPQANAFNIASGTVPTPAGNIEISWKKTASGIVGCLKHPAKLSPKFTADLDAGRWEISVY